uniref:Uncharacterized protein n=1 Tax=Romanomermis culicivorax TaxID=13658 RepID=A0A915IWP7_ROMCU
MSLGIVLRNCPQPALDVPKRLTTCPPKSSSALKSFVEFHKATLLVCCNIKRHTWSRNASRKNTHELKMTSVNHL